MATLRCDFCHEIMHPDNLNEGLFKSKAYNGKYIRVRLCNKCKEKATTGRYKDRYDFNIKLPKEGK